MNRGIDMVGVGWSVMVAFVLALTLAAVPASAQSTLDGVSIHGFGGWAFGKTDGHSYLIGTEDGAYDNAEFALNLTADPLEHLTIVAQIRGEAVGGDDQFELDYAFANYAFDDLLNARIGRVKHPFGLYGEIVDVGTLRPFYYLPQSLYGPNGYTARAYNGVGIAGWHDWESGWGIGYDLYGGQIEGDYVIAGLLTGVDDLFVIPQLELGFEVNETIGCRAVVTTPVTGLSFGFSAYRGNDKSNLPTVTPEARRNVMLASAQYVTHPWSVRAEFGTLSRGQDYDGEGGYLEVARKLGKRWELAARWDTYEVTLPNTDTSVYPPWLFDFLKHEELALGVNFWFGTKLVVRLSYSQVEGNRVAYLSSIEEIIELLSPGGELESTTDMVVFGAQFSF